MNADTILPGLNNMIGCRRHYHMFEMRMGSGYGPPFLNGDYPLLDDQDRVGELGMGVASAKMRIKKGETAARIRLGISLSQLNDAQLANAETASVRKDEGNERA